MSDKKKKKNSKKKVAGAAPVKKSNVLEEWFFMSTSELDVEKVKEPIVLFISRLRRFFYNYYLMIS